MNQLTGKTAGGSPFLALILEPGNVHKLQGGEPIQLRIEDLFPDGIPRKLELAISYSETPIADARALSKIAEVALDERTPRQKEKRPHCPECRSTIEQFGILRNQSPIALAFCAMCGCTLGIISKDVFETDSRVTPATAPRAE